jgi:hypothetical protein
MTFRRGEPPAKAGEKPGDLAALVKDLASPDPVVRQRAARGLGKAGTAAKDAVPVLKKLAEGDPDEDVREEAKKAVAAIGDAGAGQKVPGLIKDLRSPDEVVRLRAARELGRVGKPAREAVTPLKELAQKDPDPDVRAAAGQAATAIKRAVLGGDPCPICDGGKKSTCMTCIRGVSIASGLSCLNCDGTGLANCWMCGATGVVGPPPPGWNDRR